LLLPLELEFCFSAGTKWYFLSSPTEEKTHLQPGWSRKKFDSKSANVNDVTAEATAAVSRSKISQGGGGGDGDGNSTECKAVCSEADRQFSPPKQQEAQQADRPKRRTPLVLGRNYLVPGWPRNRSRDAAHYINYDGMDSLILPAVAARTKNVSGAETS
jgi:hypothetical protein